MEATHTSGVLIATRSGLLPRKDLPQIFCGSRAPSLNLITESGLYKLVLQLDKPDAKEFQNWSTQVVLPSTCCRATICQ